MQLAAAQGRQHAHPFGLRYRYSKPPYRLGNALSLTQPCKQPIQCHSRVLDSLPNGSGSAATAAGSPARHPWRLRHLESSCRRAAAAGSWGQTPSADSHDDPEGHQHPSHRRGLLLAGLAESVKQYFAKFSGLWRRFLPMLSLFFCLSFINTILDSLKDTLVITAAGGGAHVIPYLTVYAVLPMSLLFLVMFSYASLVLSRAALFNGIIAAFVTFFATFALVLYPNVGALHPHQFADQLQKVLPAGLEGGVGMLRNWTFTLFFCMSELWGDVCMGLLFWGLANETTRLEDAPTLYPLFGIGANIAQAMAGVVLKATTTMGDSLDFSSCLNKSMMIVAWVAVAVVIIHNHITKQAAATAAATASARAATASTRAAKASARAVKASSAAAAAAEEAEALRERAASNSSASSSGRGLGSSSSSSSSRVGSHIADSSSHLQQQQQQQQEPLLGQVAAAAEATKNSSSSSEGDAPKEKKPPASLRESFMVLASSMEIRCLAVMSLAQGLTTNLMEFAWKTHIKILYPAPGDFTGFLGDVATWTGVVTGGLMVATPLLFDRLGWRGVASATPQIFMAGGCVFFAASILYQHLFGAAAISHGAAAGGPAGLLLLEGLVMAGALLYIFSKGAKFSLFKPAEEMVYITLDEEGRTRGKAAIDVVGAQTGKSGGSLLQQALLLYSAGTITGILPVMFLVFFFMLRAWLASVKRLSAARSYTHYSMEEEGEEGDFDPWQSAGSSVGPTPSGGQMPSSEAAAAGAKGAPVTGAQQQQQGQGQEHNSLPPSRAGSPGSVAVKVSSSLVAVGLNGIEGSSSDSSRRSSSSSGSVHEGGMGYGQQQGGKNGIHEGSKGEQAAASASSGMAAAGGPQADSAAAAGSKQKQEL